MAQDPQAPFEEAKPGDSFAVFLLGAGLLGIGLVLAYLLYEIWPAVVNATGNTPSAQKISLFDGWIEFSPAPDSVLILLVIVSGGLGAFIHAATSLVKYVGTRRFASSWYWWYPVRFPVGAGLALVLYFALRGGLIGDDTASSTVNPYGVAAIAALAGLFSRQAVDKLGEVFETLFRTDQEAADLDAGETPVPQLKKIVPRTFSSAQGQDLKLVGGGFTDDSTALVMPEDGPGPTLLRKPNVPVAENEMIVPIAAAELAPGSYVVRIANPPPGGGVSDAELIVVTA